MPKFAWKVLAAWLGAFPIQAAAQDDPGGVQSEDEDDSDGQDQTAGDDARDGETDDGRALAVPGPKSDPPQTTRTTPAAPTPAAQRPPGPNDEPRMLLDVGHRMVFFGSPSIPVRGRLGGRPQLTHATASVLLKKRVLVGASFESTFDPARGSAPFVAEIRGGWWESAFGGEEQRGPFRLLPGTKVTYLGWRLVHDHYRGQGGEWAGAASSAGLIFGYAYAAPLGRLTVITDSQFSLYLLGWKNRTDLPIGLLNQRLSIGLDPIFIDARFRNDPATGQELSLGVSMQAYFGLKRDRVRASDPPEVYDFTD